MKDIAEAIELAFSKFKLEFGEDAKLEEGEKVIFQLNNCMLILSAEGDVLREEFIGGSPLKVDCTLKIYESEEK